MLRRSFATEVGTGRIVAILVGVTRSAYMSSRRWLRDAERGSGTPRIVCCPHSGGSATFFHSWQQRVPPGTAVLPVQYPGRHERLTEPFASSVQEMADALADEVARDSSAVVLLGHSMGSSVAFEVARRLRTTSIRVAGLIVSSHTPPTVPVTSDIHLLPDDEMWRALAKLGGTEPEILEMVELREVYTPIVRADLTISAEYVDPDATGSIDVPLIALAGTEDAIAPPESMIGWRDATTGPFALRTLEGDHFHLQNHGPEILRMAGELLSGRHEEFTFDHHPSR